MGSYFRFRLIEVKGRRIPLRVSCSASREGGLSLSQAYGSKEKFVRIFWNFDEYGRITRIDGFNPQDQERKKNFLLKIVGEYDEIHSACIEVIPQLPPYVVAINRRLAEGNNQRKYENLVYFGHATGMELLNAWKGAKLDEESGDAKKREESFSFLESKRETLERTVGLFGRVRTQSECKGFLRYVPFQRKG